MIVSQDVTKFEEISKLLSSRYSVQSISIGKQLCQRLITESTQIYASSTVQVITELIDETSSYPILCKDIDLLFEPVFQIDPFALFMQVSKNKELIVLWPGDYYNNILSYASPEHTHYRTWKNPGIEIIKI